MKKVLSLVCFCSILNFAYGQDAHQFADNIKPEDLKNYLTYIASDELEGRNTGSEGQKKAANFIADNFKKFGLEPIIKDSSGNYSYFQEFDLYKKGYSDAYLEINDKKSFSFTDYFPNGIFEVNEEIPLELTFVGYGLESDYSDKNTKGRTVVFLSGDPNNDENWEGRKGTKAKTEIAKANGAINVIEISNLPENEFKTAAAERKALLNVYSRMSLVPSEKGENNKPGFVSIVVNRDIGAKLLGVKSKTLDAYINSLKTGENTEQPEIKYSTIKIKSKRQEEVVKTANVLGFMEGTDKKDEILVITAHYDHLGKDNSGNIYNGADDDGSGTCAVIELAKTFSEAKAAGYGPRRSILFMTVTGEEKGLLGSKYFTDISPAIPLKNIVCDLNIDMIGRIDNAHSTNEKYVYLIGSDKLSSELHEISEKANKEYINYKLDYTYNDENDPNRFYYRSDHYNFAKNNIPVIFYFSGVHADYHQPSDDVEKILFDKYADITKLVYHTAVDIANKDSRIVIDQNKK